MITTQVVNGQYQRHLSGPLADLQRKAYKNEISQSLYLLCVQLVMGGEYYRLQCEEMVEPQKLNKAYSLLNWR